MNRYMKLVKEGKVGNLCKRVAWLILALGTLQVAIQIYAAWNMYHQTQFQGILDLNNFLLYVASSVFGGIIVTIFIFIILSTTGTIINALFVPDKNPDDLTISPLNPHDDGNSRSLETDEFSTREL